MINKSLGDIAYTIVDLDSRISEDVLQTIKQLKGVMIARAIQA